MLSFSELYPRNNEYRLALSLDGLWRFQFDPEGNGESMNWQKNGLPDAMSMPVPGSFSEVFTSETERDFCGDFWYETSFYIPAGSAEKKSYIRFGSVTHRCTVYCNGLLVGEHEGGFLPVVCDVTDAAVYGKENRLVVKVNNQLTETNLPCGMTQILSDGRNYSRPYFDFFNYGGIHRSVWLVQTAQEAIFDYTVTYELDGSDALIHYEVMTNGDSPVEVTLKDASGLTVAESQGKKGTLHVKNAKLWKLRNAYLYTFTATIPGLDSYSEKIGIRTIEIRGTAFYLNGEQIYLKGFGKHEDFDIIGKGFSYPVAKRDYECMKWIGANCFRTSHYPYAEEWYQMADEEGFLIIDEVPGVGLMRSTVNFMAAGSGDGYSGFFQGNHISQLQKKHMEAMEEMIIRDKNHPSVFSWSVFNEAETVSSYAHDYFAPVFELTRALDPQKRPVTGVLEKTSGPRHCQVYPLMDFVCLNRYYGWYIKGGVEIEDAIKDFAEEMDDWAVSYPNHPFVLTEYGCDTLESFHALPSAMWSQEYQEEYLEKNHELIDRYDFIQGELVWNFADFQTSQGILRVGGNKKGIFTRNRQPKQAAYLFKKRWKDQAKH